MKRDVSVVAIPFPKQLMSTARSPMSMPVAFAREVRNMLMEADGAGSKRGGVVKVGPALEGERITAVMGFMAAGGYHLMVVTDGGRICRLDGAAWTELYTGLSPEGVVRTVTFAGRLVLCNGVDEVLAYDGAAWQPVAAFVTDSADGLAFVDAATFSIESDAAFYPPGSTVRATLDGGEVTAVVAGVATAGSVVTVTLGAPVLDATLSAVGFTVKPPRFAYLAVAHDRLWGFGKGPLRPGMSGDVDRLRVFYTHGVNDHAAWPHPETGIVPGINLADKAGGSDEVVAMAVKDNITVFFGRNHMQLWAGGDPDADGDFSWIKTMPLGLVHGDALLELPNDLLFVSRGGVRTLSRTMQTEQLDISDVGAELDPTVAELLAMVMNDTAHYRRVVSIRNDADGWMGVSLFDRTLVWQIGAFGRGWVVFDGVFSGVDGSHSSPDGVVYVAKGGQLYRYDTTVWSDDGTPVATRWHVPWTNPGRGRRWANIYVEALVKPGSAVDFQLKRYRDYDDANPMVMAMTSPVEPDFWDQAEWDDGHWDSGTMRLPVARDHVVADAFGFSIESNTGSGPLTLFGIKLYGVAEK